MAEQAGERTEEATTRRRQDARRKGTVAKSMDLNGAVAIVLVAVVGPALVGALGTGMLQSMGFALREAPLGAAPAEIGRFALGVLAPVGPILLVLMGLLMVVGVAVNFAQVGFTLSGEAMMPTLAKLDPFQGVKRLLSARALVEGLKAALKTAIFAWIAYSAIVGSWPELIGLSWLEPLGAIATVGKVTYGIVLKIAGVWIALAALDYFFQRKQVDKQLRMTKQEVKQEFKESETSPELKSAMMQRRRKLGKMRLGDAVRQADVVITNPQHFAVAIAYEPGKEHAPKVVAKGQDYLAARIRELAKEAKVPLVPNPPLARALYRQCEVGDFVPRDLFQPVAEVLAYVYQTLRRVRAAR